MSRRDRDHGDGADRLGRPGGDWRGVRPTLDNPMSWSLPVCRVAGIAVRIHVIFVIYIVIRLARAGVAPHVEDVAPAGVGRVALMLACLFGIVLLHEFGHCFACRRVGGEADEILMWPLGGLASCLPPRRWAAHLVTAAGGPAVNVAIFIVLAPILGLVTGVWLGVAIPNPLGSIGYGVLDREPWWLLTLITIQDVSFLLLLFNLLPIFPLDGGRICQAALWPRFGYVRSMRLAVYAGYFGAIALGIFGAVAGRWMLVGIAVFGGITCYMTLKQLEWTQSIMGDEDDLYAAAQWSAADPEMRADEDDHGATITRASRKARRRAAAAEAEAREVDRILSKIAERGISSLTRREKQHLERVTARKREEGG